MTYEEILETAYHKANKVIDPEWHDAGYSSKAVIIVDSIFSIPVFDGGVCPDCRGVITKTTVNGRPICLTCHSTGFVPAKTLGALIKSVKDTYIDYRSR